MKITKEFRFEMAHVLSNYDGPCGNLHGHSYRCLVEFEDIVFGKAGQEGMVIDFNDVKRIVGKNVIDPMDHAFAYNAGSTDPFENELAAVCNKHHRKTVAFAHRTTAELMAKDIYATINKMLVEEGLDMRVRCSKVTLYETTTGCASYGREDL